MRTSFCYWHVFECNAHGLSSCLYKAVPKDLPSALDITGSLSLHSPSSTMFPVSTASYSLQQTFTNLLCWALNQNPELDSTGGREQKLLSSDLSPQQPVWETIQIFMKHKKHCDIVRTSWGNGCSLKNNPAESPPSGVALWQAYRKQIRPGEVLKEFIQKTMNILSTLTHPHVRAAWLKIVHFLIKTVL